MFSKNNWIGMLLSIAAVSQAHFTLEYPNPIGTYSDIDLAKGPCDGYDPTKVTDFQDYPWRGEALGLFTTHPSVIWNFNVALFSEVKNDQSAFVPMTENVQQNNGTGALCFGQVPGKKEWVGEKAIIQMIQNAPDGALYTCIAVTFTDSAPDNGGASCYNISGAGNAPYDIFWLPGTGSDLNVVSSTSASVSSTTTSTPSSLPTVETSTTSSSSESATQTSVASTSSASSTSVTGTASSATGSVSGTATGISSPSTTSSLSSEASGFKSSTSSSTKATGTYIGSPTSSAAGGKSSNAANSTRSTSASTESPTAFTGDSTKLPVTGIWIVTGLFLASFMAVGL